MRAPPRVLLARGRRLRLGGRPWLMAVHNASPDSFSGAGNDIEGADVVDVGGESARTDRPAVPGDEEIQRVVPVVRRLSAAGHLVSVDTYKPAVAEAAIAAGAAIVNDTSGLRDPDLADACAAGGAALVLVHTVGAPKEKVLDHRYGDVGAEVAAFLRERIEAATACGVPFESLLLDPGPDFGKTPAQTVAALRALPELHALERPLLLAVSRKDFVGAVTGRAPRERGAGTLAAVGFAADAGAHLLRVHDVAATRDYLEVRNALRGDAKVEEGLRLPEALRRAEYRP